MLTSTRKYQHVYYKHTTVKNRCGTMPICSQVYPQWQLTSVNSGYSVWSFFSQILRSKCKLSNTNPTFVYLLIKMLSVRFRVRCYLGPKSQVLYTDWKPYVGHSMLLLAGQYLQRTFHGCQHNSGATKARWPGAIRMQNPGYEPDYDQTLLRSSLSQGLSIYVGFLTLSTTEIFSLAFNSIYTLATRRHNGSSCKKG